MQAGPSCARALRCAALPTGTHSRWAGELSELSPASLANLLVASDERLARLRHVAAMGGQVRVALYYTALVQPRARFEVQHPGYSAWRLQQDVLATEDSSAVRETVGEMVSASAPEPTRHEHTVAEALVLA